MVPRRRRRLDTSPAQSAAREGKAQCRAYHSRTTLSCQALSEVLHPQDTLLATTMSHEGLMFVYPDRLLDNGFTLERLVGEFLPALGPGQIQRTAELYSKVSDDIVSQAVAFWGECPYNRPMPSRS